MHRFVCVVAVQIYTVKQAYVCQKCNAWAHNPIPMVCTIGSSRRDVEGGSSMSQDDRVRFWGSDNVPINVRDRLISSLTDVYIQLDNLVKFVELNHDGFRYTVKLAADLHY